MTISIIPSKVLIGQTANLIKSGAGKNPGRLANALNNARNTHCSPSKVKFSENYNHKGIASLKANTMKMQDAFKLVILDTSEQNKNSNAHGEESHSNHVNKTDSKVSSDLNLSKENTLAERQEAKPSDSYSNAELNGNVAERGEIKGNQQPLNKIDTKKETPEKNLSTLLQKNLEEAREGLKPAGKNIQQPLVKDDLMAELKEAIKSIRAGVTGKNQQPLNKIDTNKETPAQEIARLKKEGAPEFAERERQQKEADKKVDAIIKQENALKAETEKQAKALAADRAKLFDEAVKQGSNGIPKPPPPPPSAPTLPVEKIKKKVNGKDANPLEREQISLMDNVVKEFKKKILEKGDKKNEQEGSLSTKNAFNKVENKFLDEIKKLKEDGKSEVERRERQQIEADKKVDKIRQDIADKEAEKKAHTDNLAKKFEEAKAKGNNGVPLPPPPPPF